MRIALCCLIGVVVLEGRVSAAGPTNAPPKTVRSWTRRAETLRPSAPPDAPKPGVYKASPYTALVIVPPPHHDDVAVVRPGEPHWKMPIIVPDLKLVPRSPWKSSGATTRREKGAYP